MDIRSAITTLLRDGFILVFNQDKLDIVNTAKAVGGLKLPNLEKWGLGNINAIRGVNPNVSALANFGKMAELSAGKDSTSGHWEIMGLILKKPWNL